MKPWWARNFARLGMAPWAEITKIGRNFLGPAPGNAVDLVERQRGRGGTGFDEHNVM